MSPRKKKTDAEFIEMPREEFRGILLQHSLDWRFNTEEFAWHDAAGKVGYVLKHEKPAKWKYFLRKEP